MRNDIKEALKYDDFALLGGKYFLITPDEEKIFVSNFFSNTVSVIDATDLDTGEIANVITVSDPTGSINAPIGMAYTETSLGEKKIYVANSGNRTVSVIDVDQNEVINVIGLSQ